MKKKTKIILISILVLAAIGSFIPEEETKPAQVSKTETKREKIPTTPMISPLNLTAYAVTNFLEDNLKKFIKWIKGETGSDTQKEIAKKVKYVFIIGDLVDGCGIYPGQEDELIINDIYEQYEECAKYLKEIPQNIQIIACPGNHDAMRIA